MSGKQKIARDPVTAMRDRGSGFEPVFAIAEQINVYQVVDNLSDDSTKVGSSDNCVALPFFLLFFYAIIKI